MSLQNGLISSRFCFIICLSDSYSMILLSKNPSPLQEYPIVYVLNLFANIIFLGSPCISNTISYFSFCNTFIILLLSCFLSSCLFSIHSESKTIILSTFGLFFISGSVSVLQRTWTSQSGLFFFQVSKTGVDMIISPICSNLMNRIFFGLDG